MKNLLLYLLICSTLSDQASLFDETAILYDFASWRGITKEVYLHMPTNSLLTDLALPTNSWSVGVSTRIRERQEKLFLYSVPKMESILRVEAVALTNTVSAHDYLINRFAGSSVRHWNTCTNDIGDRGYSATTSIGSFSVFIRNNVYVYVSSETNAIPADPVARQIDADILQRSRGNP